MDISDYSKEFLRAISIIRLAPYVNKFGSTQLAMAMYLWNVSVCESMYPAVHCCEIALRNSMYETLSQHFGTKDWIFDRRLLIKRDGDTIGAVMKRLVAHGKPTSADNVLSELTLGFWSTMLSAPYDSRHWRKPGLLRVLFPNAPRSELNISKLHKRLNQLRNFRNRLFHHEPVWNRSDLDQNRMDYYMIGEWVSTEWSATFSKIDRFDEVLNRRPTI